MAIQGERAHDGREDSFADSYVQNCCGNSRLHRRFHRMAFFRADRFWASSLSDRANVLSQLLVGSHRMETSGSNRLVCFRLSWFGAPSDKRMLEVLD